MSTRGTTQNYEFQQWWNKHRHSFLDSSYDISTADSPPSASASASATFSAVDVSSSPPATTNKGHTRSARQLSWLWVLRFHKLSASLVWLADSSISLFYTANRRICNHRSPSDTSSSRLYKIIRLFLILVLLLLFLELLAYHRGWHFTPPSVHSAEAFVEQLYAKWLQVRADYLAPPLQGLANLCIVLFLIQSVDRAILMLGCFWIKLCKLKPIPPPAYSDVEAVQGHYPMVLVQIPMCNEREVYQQSIAAVCVQDWPRERMLVQILDDSDDPDIQVLIKAEVQKWQQKGLQIVYRHRFVRTGFKAGNLRSAMSCDYLKDCEFVAIFDADFQPAPDFLKKTIPHFKVLAFLKGK
ncbi:Probable xyloglucan glycosyltransferase 6 [Linum grandiflorum]